MLDHALRCGLAVAEFWELTPSETQRVFEAAAWRLDRELERDVRLAWHVVALDRTKRLPTLKSLLQPASARKASDADLDARAREFAELKRRMGGRQDSGDIDG